MGSSDSGPRTEAQLFRARIHPTSSDAFQGHFTVEGEVAPFQFDAFDNPISSAAWDLLDSRSSDRLSVTVEIHRKDGKWSKHSASIARGDKSIRQTFLEFSDGSSDGFSVGSAMPKPSSLRRLLSREEARELHRQQVKLEEQLWTAFEHVALDPVHRDTYSLNFARTLRDAGSLFASTLSAALREKSGITESTIVDYRDYLVEEVDSVERLSVEIREMRPKSSLLFPLEGMTKTRSPSWWQAFTQVKHDAITKSHEATLGHALHAVAATSLLDFWVSGYSQGVFVNVGIVHPASVDLSHRRFIET